MPYRPFNSTKHFRWYLVNKKLGTLPKDFFKMRFMKSLSSPLPASTVVPFAPVSGAKGIGPWGGK